MANHVAIIDRCDEIGRTRALTDEESAALERAIRRESRPKVYKRWTHADNEELMRFARQRGGVKRYAELTGRSYASVNSQLRDLKNQRRAKGKGSTARFIYEW